jgi:hypothetical protein
VDWDETLITLDTGGALHVSIGDIDENGWADLLFSSAEAYSAVLFWDVMSEEEGSSESLDSEPNLAKAVIFGL